MKQYILRGIFMNVKRKRKIMLLITFIFLGIYIFIKLLIIVHIWEFVLNNLIINGK